jgi:nucleoside triphosphate pyrophosphatase
MGKVLKVYLASKSPRRKELLLQIGVEFECLSADIDESVRNNEAPLDYVQRIAQSKAVAGWSSNARKQEIPLVAADTSVVVGEQILGKPKSKQDAIQMLNMLSDNTHLVMTCVVVTNGLKTVNKTSVTEVKFAKLKEQQMLDYIATGDCFDKAGGYGIQGYAARFIENINGSYTGVVGLPVFETAQILEQFE